MADLQTCKRLWQVHLLEHTLLLKCCPVLSLSDQS